MNSLPRTLLALTCLAAVQPAAAIEHLHLALGNVSGAHWQARDVKLDLTYLTTNQIRLQVSAASIDLPEPFGKQADVALSCPDAVLRPQFVACEQGILRLKLPQLDKPRVRVGFRYRFADRSMQLLVRDASIAKGTVNATARLDGTGWRVQFRASGLEAARLPRLLRGTDLWPQGLTVKGRVDANGTLAGVRTGLRQVELDTAVTSLGFSSADGSDAAENINLHLHGQARKRGSRWQIQSRLEAGNGILCVPTCWEIPGKPVRLDARADWLPKQRQLNARELVFEHAGVTRVRASLTASLADGVRLKTLDAHMDPSRLAGLYKTYLQPWLIDTTFNALQMDGQVSADLNYRRGKSAAARIRLQGANVDDRQGRFGMYNVSGDLNWGDTGPAGRSHIQWQGGHLYRLTLGASQVSIQAHQHSVRLLQRMVLPVLDGELQVDRFSLENPGSKRMKVEFDGLLTPISMSSFSQAMGWPIMSGKLSGVIPAVTYDAGKLEVGGVLLVRAFDGDITLRKLRVAHLFGVVPTLYADVKLDNLDLEALTRTFSFGNIQGRLSGSIDHLSMQNWSPVSFDARFATPKGDKSRHRISQKAVDNLTNLGGGGIGGALSRSFLRMFKEFSYKRIGISCHLRGGVCEMGGIAPAANGYYIVKGGGLPRIDVIGFARRVDWDVLLQRLKAITSTTTPVVD